VLASTLLYIAVTLGTYSIQLYVCVILVAVLYTEFDGFHTQDCDNFLHSVFTLAVVVDVVHQSGQEYILMSFAGE
jgi:hypothetical protein